MDAIEKISLYGTMFYVFMGIAVLGFVLAVFFFFYFDIPTVYAMMTGKAKRETVRRMEEENAKTGKLRNYYGNTGKTGKTGKKRNVEVVNPVTREYPSPAVAGERPETSVLSSKTMETAVLHPDTQETEILSTQYIPSADKTEILREPVQDSLFQVTETTLVIHTDEMI